MHTMTSENNFQSGGMHSSVGAISSVFLLKHDAYEEETNDRTRDSVQLEVCCVLYKLYIRYGFV